ncbi:MAG TPA: PD-(D/E)XK nuclease family protein, partial [Steroidobacteraceae bacterium]|nr:PD-(D/E)XK nuclease family protein [Steroidobacteraceae bacterium]
ATLDAIAGPVALDSAVRTFSSLVARSRLKGRTTGNALTITGRLADPCVRYDAIWVMGLHTAALPGPSRPDPFIAQSLQSAAGIPEATAAGTLQHARTVIHGILGAAPRVIASWPQRLADADSEPSPLIAALPAVAAAESHHSKPGYVQQIFNSRLLETLHDEQAPAIATPAQLRGGATALQLQSQCPFRAFAQHRLRAERLERPLPGIDPRTRGSFIHRALDVLWGDLKDHATLLHQSADERHALIDAAIASARAEVFGRSERWPAPLIALECARLEALLGLWLEVERERAPFQVLDVEQRLQWSQAGLTFTLRIDRVDRLDDGRTLLLDYKTGEANAKRWLGDRPEEPQMLLYATALDPAPGAVSFGLLNAEGCSFDGLSSLPPTLAGLEVVADWPAQLASWRKVLERLALAFAGGDARVDPLSRLTCDRCHLHALCRIDEVRAQRWSAAGND